MAEKSALDRILETFTGVWHRALSQRVWQLDSQGVYCRNGEPYVWHRTDYVKPVTMSGELETLMNAMEANARCAFHMNVMHESCQVAPFEEGR